MKHIWRKTLSVLLAAVMVVTLFAVPPSFAADSTYFHFSNFSTSPNSPTQVNSDTITIRGTYNGVASDSIYFKIETFLRDEYLANPTKAKPIAELNGSGVSPILEGTNGFRFDAVKLPAAGLNRITVYGTSLSGIVSSSAFVYYPNVPTIFDLKLSDQRDLPDGLPVVVTTNVISITMKAPNATNVTVQGKSAYYMGKDDNGYDQYFATGIELTKGLNELSIVASNSTMSYAITRQVIYYDDTPTVYGVKIGSTDLEGKKTIGPNDNGKLTGKISGKLLVAVDPDYPNAIPNDLILKIKDSTNNDIINIDGQTDPNQFTLSDPEKLSVTGATYSFYIFSFATTNPIQINNSGDYVLSFTGNYRTGSINFSLPFSYRSGTSPLISDILQVYNVTTDNGQATYTSSSALTDNLSFFEVPIWLAVKYDKVDKSASSFSPDATLEVIKGGTLVGSPAFAFEKFKSANENETIFKITALPAGDLLLQFTVTNKAVSPEESVTETIALTYVPTPYIDLTNIYDGKVYNRADDFEEIKGRLVNFNLNAGSPDRESLTVTVNGTVRKLDPSLINEADGTFTYNAKNQGQGLVDGPNEIIIAGTASGIPVEARITVYLFSTDTPSVINIKPEPLNNEPGASFERDGDLAYTTRSAKNMDVVFDVHNATQVVINVNGVQHTYASIDINNNDTPDIEPEQQEKIVAVGKGDNGKGVKFRLKSIPLPYSGTTSVTITAIKGITSVSQTLQVTRVPVPYELLSPKLPEEQVINQNFLEVVIRAEGAESVTIGKEAMKKDDNDIFRLTVSDLKAGKNTIKFTVTTGGTKTNGEFTIIYANQNEVGAQYKTVMPSSGKLTAFGGSVSITFPKGTMLKHPNANESQQNIPQVELLGNQQILLAIADKHDGRTVKKYNKDGEFVLVNQDGQAVSFLAMGRDRYRREHFNFASHLYWIDAGYLLIDQVNKIYKPVDALDPYKEMFYLRGNSSKWLVPTNRGTITLKYDENIRNEAAKDLSVWYYSIQDNAWKNLGGVVNTGNKTITATFNGFGYYAVMMLRHSFDDVIGHRNARNYMNTMYAKGIMEARSNSVFGAYENVTRGEFATMIVKILDLPLNYSTNIQQMMFDDVRPVQVPNALWDYRYIETAARAGIISGIGQRQFAPGIYLTREQAATIIARALNYKLGTPEKDYQTLSKQFADVGQMDIYAVPSVQAVVKNKIMAGINENTFAPKANLNRADMAIIAYNIMAKLKRI